MNPSAKNLLIAIAVVILLGIGYVAFVMPDQRSTSDKIGRRYSRIAERRG